MKFASEDLVEEHLSISLGLDILEKMVSEIRLCGTSGTKDAADLVNFLRVFVDKCHNKKEEDYLFPAMARAGIPNRGGPIAQLIIEHTQGREYLSQMAAAIQGHTLQTDKFAQAAEGYVGLMRAHIREEDTVLFPEGDSMLTLDIEKHLLEQFDVFEEEVMGEGVHEKLHETLHRLETKYQ
ncbi:MAG: hemerythrin [Clostridiales bacterium]|nr:hemerythrin [Clostridiales bacterium]